MKRYLLGLLALLIFPNTVIVNSVLSKVKTDVDWYDKEQVQKWFNDDYWKEYLKKFNSSIPNEYKSWIDMVGRVPTCQTMLELTGGFPTISIRNSCKKLFDLYKGKLPYTLVFIDFGEERNPPLMSGKLKLISDNWSNKDWFINEISTGVPMPESAVTDDHIDSLRVGFCDGFANKVFPTFAVRNSCIDLYKKNNQNPSYSFSKKYVEIAGGEIKRNSRHDECLKAKDYAGCMKYQDGKDKHSQLEKYREKDARIKAIDYCSNKDYLSKQIMRAYENSIYYELQAKRKKDPQKFLERKGIKPSTYWEGKYRQNYDKCFKEKFNFYR
tara:strand:+ start:268 stop:1245 length:978 start_codon:yes stop_codon:yes gene_type:complete